MVKNSLIIAAAALLSTNVAAQVSANATMFCLGETPVLQVSATASAADSGRVGAWFIAIHHPSDVTKVAFVTQSGLRIPDTVGDLIPYAEYTGGIPGSINVSACVPRAYTNDYGEVLSVHTDTCASTSWAFAGYVVKVGYGVLTRDHEAMLQARREKLDAAKPILLERGKWRAEYEDDEHMIRSLVISSLRDNNRVVDAMTIPAMDCSAYSGS